MPEDEKWPLMKLLMTLVCANANYNQRLRSLETATKQLQSKVDLLKEKI